MADEKAPEKAKGPSSLKRVAAESVRLQAAKKKLSSFLKHNPHSEIKELGKEKKSLALLRPWGDQSVLFLLAKPDEEEVSDELSASLNALLLPERLTAIYHRKRRSIEVLWTAYKLSAEDNEIVGRNFDFTLNKKTYKCKFSRSSDELLKLAKQARFVRVSDTSFRNLQSFTAFAANTDPEQSRFGDPLSFYIDGVGWDEESVLDVVRHLNFYLKYYDARCPHILIHPTADEAKVNPRTRYISGAFPNVISSRPLNQTLMALRIASYDEDVPTSFLLNYRILEYVSSYFLQNEQRSALRKLLATPDISSNLDVTIDNLAGIVREEKGSDINRFVKMFEELVDADKIWKQICENPDSFTKDVVLDGGFSIPPLVANTKERSSFGPKGLENVARTLRNIRNGLAHGGEAQAGRLILPTSKNFSKLLPWVHLIETAAGEVVLYEHLT